MVNLVQLVQAKEDGDKPGLEAMLQKVLQLYASRVLSKRSYAKKGKIFMETCCLFITVTQLVRYDQEITCAQGMNLYLTF